MSQPHFTAFTVQASQIGGTLSNFPVLVHQTNARFKSVSNGGNVNRTDGRDLVPYAEAACTTKLDFERELYVPSTGEFIDWVRVPSIATSTTIFYGYGDTGITTDQQNVTGTWDSNFKSVQHFSDGTTLSVADSTGLVTFSNDNAHCQANNGGPVDGCALIGHDAWITGGSAHNFTTEAFTISAWWYASDLSAGSTVGGWGIPMVFRSQINVAGYFGLVSTGGQIQFLTHQSGAAQNTTTATGEMSSGGFYYITFIRNGATVSILKNGVDITSSHATHIDPTAESGSEVFSWGTYHTGTATVVEGQAYAIDEARVSNVARSIDWELASYNCQNSQAGFWGSIQTEDVEPSSTQNITIPVLAVNWTIPSQSVSGSGSTSLSIPVLTNNWTIPSQSLQIAGQISAVALAVNWGIPTFALTQITPGALNLNDSAISTWGFPSQSLLVGQQIAINALAVNWVIPSQSLSVSGSAPLAIDVMRVEWHTRRIFLTLDGVLIGADGHPTGPRHPTVPTVPNRRKF